MSNNFFHLFLFRLYRSTFVRVFFVSIVLLGVILYVLGYWFAPYYLNKTIKATYKEQTGHELFMGPLQFDPLKLTLALHQLQDSKKLWQADSFLIDVNLKESIKQRAAIINEIQLQRLNADLLQNEQGEWNFNELLSHVTAQQKKSQPHKASSEATPLRIKKINITQAKIHNRLQLLNQLPLAIEPLNITVTDIDLRTNNAIKLAATTNINQETQLTINASLNLQHIDGDADVQVKQLPVIWFNPLLKPYAALDILQGVIDTKTHFLFSAGQLNQITSSGQLAHLQVRPTTIEQDAVKWKNLEWNNAEIILKEKSVSIPLVTLTELDSQFIISKDRKTNFQAMLIEPTAKDSSASSSSAEQEPWKFWVEKLAVNNAALGFYDESLTPRFMAIVQNFTGDITDISNDPEKLTHINLNGNVDGYAPVVFKGDAKLFIPQPQLDTLFSFHKMDMGAFTSYSAEYAGWRIKRGLLSVDLHYSYHNGKVVGKNHVVIDHLEFGEKVRSPHVIDIPLRLGLSLLTDEHGIAVLDTEVTGDPKDPKFNFKEVIMRALRNSVKKFITAPFRFIAALVNTKEDLGRVQFTPGESQLTEDTKNKLNLLQQAMQKRPNMRLNIKGVYDEQADVRALQEEQVKSTLQKRGITLDSIKARNEIWSKGVDLLYQASGLSINTTTAEDKYQSLIAQQTVTQERLDTLSHERAQAVKQYFVLKLNIVSELLLLDSEAGCNQTGKCTTSEVIFTLEE